MKHLLSVLSLLLCAASAHAQLYKWVGPDGKVNYSDTLPPPSAKLVETKSSNYGGAGGVELPYELSEAVKSNPVTLYTTANCVPCNEGRKLLNSRGTPFTEKTVSSNEDIAQLRQTGGDTQLPLLVVGRNKERGFDAGAWNAALTAAGYPESSKLPRNYLNPQAESAAPAPKPVASNEDKAANGEKTTIKPGSSELPPAIGNAPPGFRF